MTDRLLAFTETGRAGSLPGVAAIAILLLSVAGCGGTGSPSTPSPPANPNQIAISSTAAVAPVEIVVSPGSRVLFVNNDSRRHDMVSDPHPEHTLCPEINAVGLIAPGQSRETGNLNAARTCTFHDHENPDAPGLKGRIVVR